MPHRLPQWTFLALFAAVAGIFAAAGGRPATTTAPVPNSNSVGGAISSTLTGILKSSNKITRILAVDRAWADVLKTSQPDPLSTKDPFIYEAQFDPVTGAFNIAKLLPNRSYDLIVWTRDAAGTVVRWEGANMDYHRPIRPATAATDEDRKSIEGLVTEPAQFYDRVRLLHIAADHQHAAVLVELMRTRDFHASTSGEVIYRVELWYFENLFGGWAKDKNTEKVLARIRGIPTRDPFPENWQFLPQLGGLMPATTPLALTLPEKPSPKQGLAGRSK